MKKLILHIPHSSAHIPDYTGYVVSEERINLEILKLTDWHTDDLFSDTEDIKVIAGFSRVFCDVERFSDDTQEVMAKYGMGVLYAKTDSGEEMRKVFESFREEILNKYYFPHHQRLSDAVNKELKAHGQSLIVDCHSYSNDPFLRDLNQNTNRPDFCIGTDDYHTPTKLIELSKEFFGKRGYSLGINEPYGGSIVPMEHYQKNPNVHSIMLEINRKLYLESGSNLKHYNYQSIKEIVIHYLVELRKSI
jgi:N-formylglutamate amidohydrolase